jgi:hypothetical protein
VAAASAAAGSAAAVPGYMASQAMAFSATAVNFMVGMMAFLGAKQSRRRARHRRVLPLRVYLLACCCFASRTSVRLLSASLVNCARLRM